MWCLASSQNKRQVDQRNRKINRRIAIIIATDFCCWVPFIIVCAFHFLEVLDAISWYSLFSIIILPINSVINPLLYNEMVTGVLTAPFRTFSSITTNSAIYRSFRTRFSTTPLEEMEMGHVGCSANRNVKMRSKTSRKFRGDEIKSHATEKRC